MIICNQANPIVSTGVGFFVQPFGVTQTDTGTTTFPGAGFPTSTRSALTSSPVSRLNDAHGLGMRPKVIFWIGWPVVEFMIVAIIGMFRR
jgi:hypothetical protein